MKRVVMIMVVALLFGFVAGASAQYDELIKKVDNAWTNRSGNTAPMKNALAMAEKAYGEKPGFDAAWRAARACFWIADRTENKSVDAEYGGRGADWARKATKEAPNKVRGYYYLALNLGEYGKGIGILKALFKGVGGDFEDACNKAISINPKYDNGGIYRAFGRYYFKLPRPKYDSEKSEAFYKKALAVNPNITRTYFYQAELYVKEELWGKAKSTLDKLAAINATDYENKYFINQGKILEAKVAKESK